MGLSGSLRTISLAEIIQTLGRSGATGVLSLTSPAGARDVVFQDGTVIRVVNQDAGVDGGASLIERLVALGAVPLDVATMATGSGGFDTVATLEHDNLVEPATLRSALQQVQQDDVVDLFVWDNASFAFREATDEDDPMARQLVSSSSQFPILSPVSNLLMESARRIDEWTTIKDQLPDGRSVPYLFPDREADVRASSPAYPDALILDAIDGVRSMDQIVDEAPVSSIDGYTVLYHLLASGGAGLYRIEQMVSNGRQLLEAGDGERAATLLRHALAVDPSNSEGLQLLAHALEMLGDGQEAARCFAQVALSALKQGQSETALSAARRCSELGAGAEFQLTLVMVLVETDQLDLAVAELHQLANRLIDERRLSEAKTTCLKILQLAPEDQEARRILSRLYAEGDGVGDQHVSVCVVVNPTHVMPSIAVLVERHSI